MIAPSEKDYSKILTKTQADSQDNQNWRDKSFLNILESMLMYALTGYMI